MFCPHCGNESTGKDKFCRNCGGELTVGGVDERISEPTALTKEVQEIRNELSRNNSKLLFWLLAAAILWFIAINPAQGNFLGITYLDLALADCGDSSPGLSSGFDSIDDLGNYIEQECRDSREEARIIVVFAIIVICVLIRMATKKPKLQKKASSNRAIENDDVKLSEAIKIAKKAEEAAKALEKAIGAQESSEAEWEDLKRLDGIKRAEVRKTALASILAGIVVAGAITVMGSSEVVLTPEQSEASSPYALYISWGVALISFAKLSTNPVIPGDHPLKALRDSLPKKRREAEQLDAQRSVLAEKFGVRTYEELKALEAERLSFVETGRPNFEGVTP
jgi:hypothetical protein